MRIIRYTLLCAALLAVGAISASAQTNSKEIMARKPAELVELLKNPNATVFEKAKACQRLAVVGTKDAVPALAALLGDEHLNLYARCGLEGIADPSADAAMREAAGKLQGRQLAGVLNSIGHRRDAQAVALLKGFLGNCDAVVASAAAGALGHIATPEAAAALQESLGKCSPAKAAVSESAIVCADTLAANGKKLEASVIYQAIANADVAKHIKTAAILGVCRVQQGAAKDLLLAQIRNADKEFFAVGLAVAREMPGGDVTAALADELKNLSPERQALLLAALGDRKATAPLALFVSAAKSQSAAVREAAIRVLAKRNDATAVAVLLDAAVGQDTVAATAKDCLKTLPWRDVDTAIIARLAGADSKAKIVLIELLGSRRVVAALPAVRAAVADADGSVRSTAFASLGQLADLSDIDLLTDKALADAPGARAALKIAAMRMSDRDGCAAKLAGKLQNASAANQAYLLELLGKVSGRKALETVAAGAKSADPAVKESATRVLGEWLSADAAPTLLEIAKTDAAEKYQVRALRGYIRIARQLQLPADTKLAMFRTAMEAAKRNQEKQLALDILTRIPSGATVELAASYVDKPALKDSAAGAAVKIAAKLIGSDPKAVAAAMQKLLAAGVIGDSGDRAKQLLGQAQSAAK